MHNVEESLFNRIFRDIALDGQVYSPRGLKIIEIEDYIYHVPPYSRFCNFKSRKLNLNYIKTEFQWYLRGDKTDTTICDHASLWKSLVTDRGTINSNYGQYIFGEVNQIDEVVKELRSDRETRRAAMTILNSSHIKSSDKDLPCTYSLSFRIRDNKLTMSVNMRSQDAIFGMAQDLPIFSFIHEMVLSYVKETYPEVELGLYTHKADSFHVYEKHFDVTKRIAACVSVHPELTRDKGQEKDEFTSISCPKISGVDEVEFLRTEACDMTESDIDEVPEEFEFTRWLLERD